MKNTIEVRALKKADHSAVEKIASEASDIFYEWAIENGDVFTGFPDFTSHSLFNLGECLVAVVEGHVAGYVFYKTCDDYLYIVELDVHKNFRGNKLGILLIQSAMEEKAKFRKLVLTTYEHVPWNAPYYSKNLDFKIMADEKLPKFLKDQIDEEKSTFPFHPEKRVGMIKVIK